MSGIPYIKGRLYPMDFTKRLGEAEKDGPFVFLETSRVVEDERCSYLFTRPVRILEAFDADQVELARRTADEALGAGYWIAGYWAYELGYLFESRLVGLLDMHRPRGPLMWLGVFRKPEVWRHGLDGPSVPLDRDIGVRDQMGPLELEVDRSEYVRAIARIKDYIRQGHTYQVNYTVRGRFDYSGTPLDMYRALRAQQAVSYSALVNTGERSIVSMSPELFFHKKGGWIWSRPMKGTVHRGRTVAEDMELARFLASDPKNRAENVMIVDLLRNDLGRLCETGSVSVPDLFSVERYQTLFQMTSTIRGRLAPGADWLSLLRHLFPCGSVTGAPKIRTMEIIAELESSPRDVYTGSIGYVSPGGESCLSVAIRTVILQGGRAEIGIGSGVTMDSDPDAEYEECALKADFLKRPFNEFELIETLRWEPEKGYFLLDKHLDRLMESAEYFSFAVSRDAVVSRLRQAAGDFIRVTHRVRLTVSRDGRVAISSLRLKDVPTPVLFDISGQRVDAHDPFLFHKTTNRSLFDKEHERAVSQGLFDTLFLNERGELTQGAITNLFIKKDNRLYTPVLDSGLLPGTLRRHLIETGEAREAVLRPEDLSNAREIYLGNSVRGLLRARKL